MSTDTIQSHTDLGSYADVVKVVASHCCMCRRELTDASSVQNGIGPICSNKYYSDAHVCSEEEVLKGTGSLAISGLPDNVIDAVLAQIDKGNARQACNLLVYFASAHYEDRDTVFKVSPVVRDFGYTLLADKLEEDRTKVTIRKAIDDEGNEVIRIGLSLDKWEARRDFQKVSGAKRHGKEGRRYIWTFPADTKTTALVECLMGFYYGNELATVEGGFMGRTSTGITHIPRRSWAELQAFRNPASGTTTASAVTQTTKGGGNVRIVDPGNGNNIEFWSPYNAAWLADMKSRINYRSRRWNGSCWTFEPKVVPMVKDLAQKHYGVSL
jgi:hypothetical protein